MKVHYNTMTRRNVIGLILAAVIVAAAVVWYVFFRGGWGGAATPQEEALKAAGDAAQTLTQSVSQGVLPSLGTNPLQNQPDVNPLGKANPFSGVKINPFQ